MAAEAAKRFEEGKALSVFDGVPVGVKEQMLVVLMTVTKTVFIVTSNNSVFRNRITCVVAQYFWERK